MPRPICKHRRAGVLFGPLADPALKNAVKLNFSTLTRREEFEMLAAFKLTHFFGPEIGLRGIRRDDAYCFVRPSAFMKSTCAERFWRGHNEFSQMQIGKERA
jgi:hypothetical protein